MRLVLKNEVLISYFKKLDVKYEKYMLFRSNSTILFHDNEMTVLSQ